MVKVTPHENLVPDTRSRWVKSRPSHDFINDPDQADKFIRAASQFFHLRKGRVIFSGYALERKRGTFTINLWHRGVKVRCLVLANIGYSGVLHCEAMGVCLEEVVGWDLIGSLALSERTCLSATAG